MNREELAGPQGCSECGPVPPSAGSRGVPRQPRLYRSICRDTAARSSGTSAPPSGGSPPNF